MAPHNTTQFLIEDHEERHRAGGCGAYQETSGHGCKRPSAHQLGQLPHNSTTADWLTAEEDLRRLDRNDIDCRTNSGPS